MDAELITLATAAGTAVAQAAGTDVWAAFRGRVARLFGRGGAEEAPSRVVLERLDRTATEVADGGPGEEGRERAALAWRTRFLDLLEEADGAERDGLADGLRELVALAPQTGRHVSASDGGVAVGGDLRIEARGDRSVAALRIGNVTIGNPPVPGTERS